MLAYFARLIPSNVYIVYFYFYILITEIKINYIKFKMQNKIK